MGKPSPIAFDGLDVRQWCQRYCPLACTYCMSRLDWRAHILPISFIGVIFSLRRRGKNGLVIKSSINNTTKTSCEIEQTCTIGGRKPSPLAFDGCKSMVWAILPLIVYILYELPRLQSTHRAHYRSLGWPLVCSDEKQKGLVIKSSINNTAKTSSEREQTYTITRGYQRRGQMSQLMRSSSLNGERGHLCGM